MYYDNYTDFPHASLNPVLLWEYDLSDFDYQSMRNIVVQRVIERGWPNDWYFMLNYYGMDRVKSTIKDLLYLNDKDMNFVSHQFGIPLKTLRCYEKKQSLRQHWDS